MRLSVLASLLLLFALPGTPADAKKHHCNPPGAKSVARDERGRVYYIDRDGLQYYYACLYRTGRTRPVGDNPHDIDLDIVAVRLASPYVAFKQFYRSSQGTATDLSRLDMRTGRTVNLEPLDGIRRFVVTSFGAVVWIHPADGEVEVKKIDSDGRATLDQGTNVPGRSLQLSEDGHRVRWRTDGQPKSARLR